MPNLMFKAVGVERGPSQGISSMRVNNERTFFSYISLKVIPLMKWTLDFLNKIQK